jgi:hypothetical protein
MNDDRDEQAKREAFFRDLDERAIAGSGPAQDDEDSSPKLIVHNAGQIRATPIPPRQWLLGNTFCRKFLSSLVGSGGEGKTAVRYAQYLAVASGRKLTGEHVHCRGRVLIVCLEDDLDEVRRRVDAAMRHHKVSPKDIDDWLFYCAPRGLKLLLNNSLRGGRIVGPLYAELRVAIAIYGIDLVGLDPFIKSHGVEENDNNAIDEVCILLAQIADEFNCATDLLHHSRKGMAAPGDADRSRGASAAVDAGRLVRTITRMSEAEADAFGITKEESESLIRLDDAKVNLMPRCADAMWFKLIGVALHNGTDAYPKGDNIQTVERWTPPNNFAGVPSSVWTTIIDEIDAGLPDGRRYSNANSATERAAWKVVVKHLPRTEKQARAIINTWVKNQVLFRKPYEDPIEHKRRVDLTANPAKRPGPRGD